MPYLLEVPLSDGGVLLFDVSGQAEGVAPVGRGKDIVGRLPEGLAQGLSRVRVVAGEVLQHVRQYPESPTTVSVEFGLVLTAKTGLVVAESSGEAHIKVT